MKLRDYIKLDANDELHIFMKSSKNGKITGKMKYDAFVKKSLETLRPVIIEYTERQDAVFKGCVTVTQIESLVIPALPDHIKEVIIQLVEKQKHLDIVEQTYLCLDLLRAVSNNLGTKIGKMAMHYANAIRVAPTIIRPNGKSF